MSHGVEQNLAGGKILNKKEMRWEQILMSPIFGFYWREEILKVPKMAGNLSST